MVAFVEIVGFALLLPGFLVVVLGVLVMFGLGFGGEIASGFLGGAAVCIAGLMLCGPGQSCLPSVSSAAWWKACGLTWWLSGEAPNLT